MNRIVKLLRKIGQRRPYFHIFGADGSLYMGRWWLFGGSAREADRPADQPREWKPGRIDAWIGQRIAARLHHIAREDRARDFHNHPATFISIVICGWYRERQPNRQGQHPGLDCDLYFEKVRRPGSIALRWANDRHTISEVAPEGAWTVVIWFRKKGSWGFFTRNGFVNWRHYEVSP